MSDLNGLRAFLKKHAVIPNDFVDSFLTMYAAS